MCFVQLLVIVFLYAADDEDSESSEQHRQSCSCAMTVTRFREFCQLHPSICMLLVIVFNCVWYVPSLLRRLSEDPTLSLSLNLTGETTALTAIVLAIAAFASGTSVLTSGVLLSPVMITFLHWSDELASFTIFSIQASTTATIALFLYLQRARINWDIVAYCGVPAVTSIFLGAFFLRPYVPEIVGLIFPSVFFAVALGNLFSQYGPFRLCFLFDTCVVACRRSDSSWELDMSVRFFALLPACTLNLL